MIVLGSSLVFLFHIACTIHAAPFPKQSSGFSAKPLEKDALTAPSDTTTLGLVGNTSSPLNASAFAIRCHATPVPITIADYYEAVQQILIRDDAMIPLSFEIGPTPDTSFRWLGGQAAIAFFNLQPLLTAEMPIILVAHVASLIADECIIGTEAHNAGGYAHVGMNRGMVGVTVGSPGIGSYEEYEGAVALL